MNWKPFIRSQKPVATLIWAIIYGAATWFWVHNFFSNETLLRWFILATVGVPLTFSFFITSSLYELVHKPFFFLLPGTRRILRTWYSCILGAVAVICLLWLRFCDPATSSLGALGVILVFLILPSFRRHNPAWYGVKALLGLVIFLGALKFGAAPLRSFVTEHSLLTLLLGLAFALYGLKRNLSRSQMRERAAEPFHSMQTVMSNRDISAQERAHWLKEREAAIMGSTWKRQVLDGSTLSWMRAILHTRFGRSRLGSYQVFALALIGPFAALVSMLVLTLLIQHRLGGREFLENLAQIGFFSTPLPKEQVFIRSFPLLMMPVFALIGVANSFGNSQPVLPISRCRTARILALLGISQGLLVLIIPVMGLMLVSWVCALSLGIPFSTSSSNSFLATILTILPAIPWLLCGSLIRRSLFRVLLGILVVVVTMGGPLLVFFLCNASYGFTPGILCSLLIAALGAMVYWKRMHREYRTRDLQHDQPDAIYLGMT